MKSLNAEANLISMSIHEEMNKNNCSIGSHPNFKFITILLFYICISVRVPPDKQNQQEVYIKKYFARYWFIELWGLSNQL